MNFDNIISAAARATALSALLFAVLQGNISTPALAKENELFVPQAQVSTAVMITTTESFQGYRIKEYRGIVRGVTVRQPTISQGLKASLKGIVGGKMSPFITMCETARQQALDVMIERARQMGANAIVGMRYDSSAFGDQDDMGTEVVCYGTAVIIEPEQPAPQKSAAANVRLACHKNQQQQKSAAAAIGPYRNL